MIVVFAARVQQPWVPYYPPFILPRAQSSCHGGRSTSLRPFDTTITKADPMVSQVLRRSPSIIKTSCSTGTSHQPRGSRVRFGCSNSGLHAIDRQQVWGHTEALLCVLCRSRKYLSWRFRSMGLMLRIHAVAHGHRSSSVGALSTGQTSAYLGSSNSRNPWIPLGE